MNNFIILISITNITNKLQCLRYTCLLLFILFLFTGWNLPQLQFMNFYAHLSSVLGGVAGGWSGACPAGGWEAKRGLPNCSYANEVHGWWTIVCERHRGLLLHFQGPHAQMKNFLNYCIDLHGSPRRGCPGFPTSRFLLPVFRSWDMAATRGLRFVASAVVQCGALQGIAAACEVALVTNVQRKKIASHFIQLGWFFFCHSDMVFLEFSHFYSVKFGKTVLVSAFFSCAASPSKMQPKCCVRACTSCSLWWLPLVIFVLIVIPIILSESLFECPYCDNGTGELPAIGGSWHVWWLSGPVLLL